jgi:hypothetical protein
MRQSASYMMSGFYQVGVALESVLECAIEGAAAMVSSALANLTLTAPADGEAGTGADTETEIEADIETEIEAEAETGTDSPWSEAWRQSYY